MDRTALSKRIGGLADVFAAGSPIRRELEAMSFALDHMRDEKFASILNEGYEADDKDSNVRGYGMGQPVQKHEFSVSQRARQPGGETPVFEPRDPKAALKALMSDPEVQKIIQRRPDLAKMAGIEVEADIEQPEGNAWNREASDAVIRNLVSDVLGREAMTKAQCCDTGRKLEKNQMPDAEKKQETPSTLTEDQTPKLSESLDSGIYEKSKGSVRKEAADEMPEAEEPKAEKPEVEEPKAEKPDKTVAQEQREKRTEEKAEKTREEAKEKAEDTAEALQKLDNMTAKKASEETTASMIMFDGIELTAPMDEVSLTEEDARKLSCLFR